MADALAAREQRISELLGRHARVAVDVLEPFGRVARRILDAQHLDAAQVFIVLQGRGKIARVLADRTRQLDRVFERELGARADREVRRVRGVAHQHDGRLVAARLAGRFFIQPMHPVLAHDTRKANPLRRAFQMRRVRHQPVAVEARREQLLAPGDRLFLRHVVEAGLAPHVFGRFDDEGGGGFVEAIGVRLEPAGFGFLEGEGEGVEQLLGAEPDESAQPRVDVGSIRLGVLGADAAVQAVAGDHEVGVGIVFGALHVGLELQFHAEFLAAPLQDVEQTLAADAAKPVAARDDLVAADVDLDVVPMAEGVEDLGGALRVGRLQVAERLVGEHHAPAEGVVCAVALDDHDLVVRVLLLHEQREVEAGRATADADDFHKG